MREKRLFWSPNRDLKCIIGKSAMGTYSVLTVMVGDADYLDLPIFKQTGIESYQAAVEYIDREFETHQEDTEAA